MSHLDLLKIALAVFFAALVVWSMFSSKNKVDHTIARILDGTPNHNRRITDK